MDPYLQNYVFFAIMVIFGNRLFCKYRDYFVILNCQKQDPD